MMSGEVSNPSIRTQSTEFKFAVYGQHGINKKGELIPLNLNEQTGLFSKLGTSLSWHFGQIDRSQDAIDAYNQKIKNSKHIHLHVNIEENEDGNLVIKKEGSVGIDNASKQNDQKLIRELDEAEKKLHHAEKDLKNALLKAEAEIETLTNENEQIRKEFHVASKKIRALSADINAQKNAFEEKIAKQEDEHKKTLLITVNKHAQMTNSFTTYTRHS